MITTPHAKLHVHAVSATVFLMFSVLALMIPWIGDWLQGSSYQILGWGAALVASAFSASRIYVLIASFLISQARSRIWLKRLYLGREFVHGTWVGLLRTKKGYRRLYVEQFDQDLDELTIRGASFRVPEPTEDKLRGEGTGYPLDATWISRATRINPITGELYCFYENNVVRKHYPVLAVGHFNLEFEANNQPSELRGYAIDVDAGIELAKESIAKLSESNLDANSASEMLSYLEDIDGVRLSYDRAIRTAETQQLFGKELFKGWGFWPFEKSINHVLTTEQAKIRGIEYFSDVLEAEALQSRNRVSLSTLCTSVRAEKSATEG